MGARQSKRSVDITTGEKKGDICVEESGKLERLEEGDVAVKATQNGTAPHADKEASSPVTEEAQPLVNSDSTPAETAEKKEETQDEKSEEKDDSLVNGAPESPAEKSTDEAAATPDKEKKKKEKSKKKWSFRSISFSRKDKSKPNVSKDDSKNGNVTKEEPVAEVVEAEAVGNTEAIPIKDDEPKKDETLERTEEEKKEAKPEASTEPPSNEAVSPPAPEEPAPVPAPEPAPAPAPVPVPATIQTPEPVPEPAVEDPPAAPVVEEIPEPPEEMVPEPPVAEPVVEVKAEVKVEELPPPLPASPPPTEAPPPTPVAPTPALTSQIPDLTLHVESDTQETEVVGGGESMAEPVDVEPVSDTEEKMDDAPLVNGISDHSHQFVEEIDKKVEIDTENLKKIVSETIITTQVAEKSEEISEQTASAAE